MSRSKDIKMKEWLLQILQSWGKRSTNRINNVPWGWVRPGGEMGALEVEFGGKVFEANHAQYLGPQ